MIRRHRRLLAAGAVIALASAALAQERPTSILPPGFGDPTPPAPPTPAAPQNGNSVAPVAGGEPAPSAAPGPAPGGGEDQIAVSDELSSADQAAADLPEPQEVPDSARRDPDVVGRLDPASLGLGANPWGSADGAFLERAMRLSDGTMASRWLHIALRNALLAKAEKPYGVNPVDWVAERSWLLLRMGEADASRMLVSGVDVGDFTSKLAQVAVQSALANADPAGLCPVREPLGDLEPRVSPLIDAICSSLAGNPEAAAADIDNARRRSRIGGIDVSLADKLVGAGANTSRAVNVEWDPVDRMNVWRFGLASASGLAVPDRLIGGAPLAMRGWQARAPMLSIEQRLPSAWIAAGMGVFSGQSLVDLYSGLYDRTDPDELTKTDAWQLRLAFVGKDLDARLAAMRKLWTKGTSSIDREAARAMLGLAASRVTPDASLAVDAPDLIASMLAAGMDDDAARWIPVIAKMDDKAADACWAMLALAAPNVAALDLSESRVDKFIGRDATPGHRRGMLLVAGLAGLNRLDGATAGKLSARYGFGLERKNEWTRLIDGAAARGQGGTATVLAGLAFQSPQWNGIPALFLYHSVSALSDTGQAFNARMIAAEALSRS